jgi:hypothetical protein
MCLACKTKTSYFAHTLRPTDNLLKLNNELEPLRALIMLQHEAFTIHTTDLGDIN